MKSLRIVSSIAVPVPGPVITLYLTSLAYGGRGGCHSEEMPMKKVENRVPGNKGKSHEPKIEKSVQWSPKLKKSLGGPKTQKRGKRSGSSGGSKRW